MPAKDLKLVEVEMVKRLPFAGATVGPVRALIATGHVRAYRKGTYLCHQGEEAPDVFFLLSGRLEVSSSSPNGTRMFHATVDEPQFVGELGAFGDMDRTASIVALVDSNVWVGPAEEFVKAVVAEPKVSNVVLRALARQVQAGQAFVDDLLFLDLKGRVAKRLLQMVTPDLDDLPPDGSQVPEVTQADLASLCGGSRENVARILKELERRDVILREGHRYVLRNVATLAKIAEV
ncbi:MAG: family transcriptional regulator, cyclic receptor protein [Actinomycetota bacterium]|jgi:CRP-like cAMP-binding protein|nr:family transcriptional regulator, cyclic receptor protein [Actinomycetota bacterium]